jgi:cation diffusion facilitator CzcD-associated flavoprotein CzcO
LPKKISKYHHLGTWDLAKDNVRVVTEPISEIIPEEIKLSSGEIIHVDVLLCATGFDISFRP